MTLLPGEALLGVWMGMSGVLFGNIYTLFKIRDFAAYPISDRSYKLTLYLRAYPTRELRRFVPKTIKQ